MARIYIGVGHGGTDSGAVYKNFIEKDINLIIAKECKRVLQENGQEVYISRESDITSTIHQKTTECDNLKCDYAIDIHTNAGGGKGFEAYHTILGGKGKFLCENIEKEVLKIGQNSRGCKTKVINGRDYYGFIRQTKCPSAILECAFLDNEQDRRMIDSIEKKKAFGVAYAKGILNTLNVKINEQEKLDSTFKVKIEKNVAILKNVDVVDTITGGIYTITEVKNGWGKLKSGIGWICLDNVTRL